MHVRKNNLNLTRFIAHRYKAFSLLSLHFTDSISICGHQLVRSRAPLEAPFPSDDKRLQQFKLRHPLTQTRQFSHQSTTRCVASIRRNRQRRRLSVYHVSALGDKYTHGAPHTRLTLTFYGAAKKTAPGLSQSRVAVRRSLIAHSL